MKRAFYFSLLLIFLLLSIGVQTIYAYLINHDYYFEFLASADNYLLLFLSIIISLIPVGYLSLKKAKTIKWILISLLTWLILFGIAFISLKWGVGSNYFLFIFNVLLVFWLCIVFIFSLFLVWNLIKEKLLKIETDNIFQVFLSFGVWLSAMLILIYTLMSFNLLYSIISWLIFIWSLMSYFLQKESVINCKNILLDNLKNLYYKFSNNKLVYWFYLVLLVASVLYIYFGFLLAYIPYPTAWDANHAYMFYPKMWALNNWFYWDESGMMTRFQLWYSYITYWFSLSIPLEQFLWISSDTFAIVANYFSGIFVLLFWLALIREVIDYIAIKFNKVSRFDWLIFATGWLLLLLWLTSGMWAFLVFVDNKTDLWVMTFVVLAIYSWFIAIRKVLDTTNDSQDWSKPVFDSACLKLFWVSWFLFAMAVMSKPTAFLDAVGFGLLLSWLWIWSLAVIGAFLIIIWLLSFVQFRWIRDYISYYEWFTALMSWIVVLIWSFAYSIIKKAFSYLLLIFIWWISFVITLFVFKWTYVLYEYHQDWKDFEKMEFLEDVFLSKTDSTQTKIDNSNETQNYKSPPWPLLASLENTLNKPANNDCSLENIDSVDKLYEDLKEAPGDTYAEDVWRYIWYWRKQFENPWWWAFFPWGNTCIWPRQDANILCEKFANLNNISENDIENAYQKLSEQTTGHELINNIYSSQDFRVDDFDREEFVWTFSWEIDDIKDYYQWKSIYIEDVCIVWKWTESPDGCVVYENESLDEWDIINQKDVYIPYSYLVPFNKTFNWSLQNPSSYYTDVWYIRLILLFTLFVWLLYWLFVYDRFLIWISFVTLFLWVLWFFIWWWILWYWLGLIVWSIIAFIVFVHRLAQDSEEDNIFRWTFMIFIWIFLVMWLFMLVLNFFRISTQGGSGPFMWYKQSVGMQEDYENILSGQGSQVWQDLVIPYTAEDVFDLQFGHYKDFLDAVNDRPEDEWVYIAGTYARYFVENQRNIRYDQFLTWLWEKFSDEDVCNSYLRLKDQWMNYIAIDPNIWTVIMGDGNISLFHRFFAEVDENENEIKNHWAISMLSKMVNEWYAKYLSSNNIWAKYAFSLSDEQLQEKTSYDIWDDSTLFRSRLATARYWTNDQQITNSIVEIFNHRMESLDAIWDVADILWRQIDKENLKITVQNLLWWDGNTQLQWNIERLSSDEKEILVNFLSIYETYMQDQQSYLQLVNWLVSQSISASSQIIVLELD